MDSTVWYKNIFQGIQAIADIEFQRQAWLGNHRTQISSFTETINTLYDDFSFEDFLKSEKDKIDQNLLNNLTRLDQLIDQYEEKESDELILNDPSWLAIVDQAKVCAELWGKN